MAGDVKLLLCRFCGATFTGEGSPCNGTRKHNYVGNKKMHYVECGWCHARGPLSETTDDAIAAWNTRCAPSDLVGALEWAELENSCSYLEAELQTNFPDFDIIIHNENIPELERVVLFVRAALSRHKGETA